MHNAAEFLYREGRLYNTGDHIVVLIEDTMGVFAKSEGELVINEVRMVSTDAFGVKIEEQSIDGIRDHLVNVNSCFFICIHYIILGFVSIRLFHELNLSYIHGMAVKSGDQSKGVGSKLLTIAATYYKKKMLACTTQNPVMYDLLSRFCKRVFPAPNEQIVPAYIKMVGGVLMERRRGVFDYNTFVANSLYSQCLYGRIPQSKNASVDDWFRKSLDIQDGISRNGILLVGELKN